MTQRIDLEITIDYKLSNKYSKLILEREWVVGIQTNFRVNIVNKTTQVSPRTSFGIQATEQGYSWSYARKLEVPELKPGILFQSTYYSFTPSVDGVCRIMLIADILPTHEIWITGLQQSVPLQNQSINYFRVINRQDLDMIDLLKQLLKSKR